MARIFIDGFESGSLDLWDTINGGSAETAQKKTGAYSYFFNGNAQTIIKNFPAIHTLVFKFWVYFTYFYTNANIPIIYLSDNTGVQVSLSIFSTIGTTGTLKIWRYLPDYYLLGTGTTSLALNTWYLFEGKIFINDSGTAQIKLNGISSPYEIDFSGDTQYQTGDTITKIEIGGFGGAVHKGYLDDFVLEDANWIGDTRIYKKQATGAGNSAGWTPSTGNNWACVDEIPASDSDYLTTNSNDIVDSYATGSLPGAVTSVKCLQVQARCVREGSSTPTTIKPGVRSGGTDYPKSAGIAVPASIKSLAYILETDPATGVAWTPTGVNNAELLVKSAA